jgi:peptide/nickel transport system substrate-binding protein
MKTKQTLWIVVAAVVVVAAVGIGIAASNSNNPATASTSGSTINYAEGAGASPNYIFPYMGVQYFSVDNTEQFQEMMYRPLYWFGLGASVAYVPSLSLADSPVYSNGNKTVTITMKGWKFADGQTVNAQSVMFFLNMYKADPTSYAGYNPGYGIPDQVKNASGSGNTVTINFTTSVNPNWLLYNYLSEITPFPNSWDLTSATTPGTCATGVYGAKSTDTTCKAVEKYLDAQAAETSTYTDKLWQSADDGPWKLTAFDSLGNLTMVPNKKYSGPVKAKVAFVKEFAYTSATAEQNDLSSGKIDIGYLDPTILTKSAPSPGKVGPNWAPLASTYTLVTGTPWSFNYAPFNFGSGDPKHAAVAQLYIRQALQEAVDQLGIIKKVDKGYGVPTYSPIPPNTPTAISAIIANPYPFSLAKAKALLTSHGWKEEGGVQTCVDPGTGANQCGAGITKGYTLNFKIVWSSGQPALDDTFNTEVEDWASIGIKFSTATGTFNQVIADCTSAKQQYDICSWGAGWIYAPDFYPSGETLFTTKGGFNPGAYNSPKMNAIINTTTFGTANLTKYAQYAAAQLPVLYQPNPTAIVEIKKGLKSSIGFAPNPLGNLMPEYYSF